MSTTCLLDRIPLLTGASSSNSNSLLRLLLLLLVVVLLLLVDVSSSSSSSSSSSKRMSSKEWKLQKEHSIAIPSSHNCIHDKVMGGSVPPVVHGVRHDTPYVKNKRGVRQILQGDPIRMIIDTTYLNYSQDPDRLCNVVGQWAKVGFPGGSSSNPTPQCADEDDNNCWFRCITEDVLSSDKLAFLQDKVIPDVKDFFESALNLDRVIGNLILTGSTCGCSSTPGVTMPSIYTTTGVAADIVIFLTARTTRFQGNTIAFACPCYDDAVTRRPIAGFINWGPNRISLDNPAYPEQLGVGIHEITHVLGFTSGKYAYYGSPTGSAVVTERVNLTSPGLAPKTVMVLKTPKVVEVAKEYYGCDSLIGVELEDGGSSGTTASHWERRLLMNEYMTGYSSYDPRKSVFTLALLEDTSWYYPNYSVADALYWGKNGGCDFVQKRCNTRVSPYNVATANDEGCIWDGKRKGRSNLVTYTSDLDPWNQYYSAPDIGGRDDLADFCGFLQYRKDYRGDCTLSEYNTPGDDYYLVENFGEWFCPSCQCISATDTNGASGGSCHNFTCANNKLMIKIANAWYECLENNYEIKVSDPFEEYVGKYYCPKDVQATCSAAPQDTAVWPTFDSVSPQSGGVNDEITITANNFGSQPVVYLGNYHGCVDSSIQVNGNQIKCIIGVRELAPTIRENTKVDVIVQDTSGRTAVGVNAFELSASTQVLPSVVLLLVSAFLFL